MSEERERRFSRGAFLAGAASGFLGILGYVYGRRALEIYGFVDERLADTFEQIKAQEFLRNAQDDNMVRQIVVVGKKSDKKYNAPLIFNKPAFSFDPFVNSKKLGEIAVGTKIDEAIVVLGADPGYPFANKTARWLAYYFPQNSGRIVFSQARFYSGIGIGQVPPFDVWERGQGL